VLSTGRRVSQCTTRLSETGVHDGSAAIASDRKQHKIHRGGGGEVIYRDDDILEPLRPILTAYAAPARPRRLGSALPRRTATHADQLELNPFREGHVGTFPEWILTPDVLPK